MFLQETVVDSERDHRLDKLARLRERGIDPYPVGFRRDHTLAGIRERYPDLGPDAATGEAVRVAGRLMLVRRHGGLVFLTLADQTGTLQLLATRDELGEEAFADVEHLDRGDWVGAAGTVMATHTGELTLEVAEVTLLSKALRALPDKHRGLADPEARLRQRYLDLIVNPETRRTFDVRSSVIATVRRVLVERGFTEVETPVLDGHAGGAAARPFVTHHNALDLDMYMRIALELPLKRLVVGGFERVFEIGRVFRNEGLDTRHNPEFTLLEAYQALGDYHDMMELVETICSQAALAATGTTVIDVEGRAIDLAPPWRRATMADLVHEHAGVRMHPAMPIERGARDLRPPRDPLPGRLGRGPADLRGLRRDRRARAGRADLRHGPPARGLPARARAPRRRHAGRALRGGRRRARAGQRLQRAQRPGRPARALRGRGARQGGRRRRGGGRRRGLHPRARVRPAADRRPRHRYRPARDAGGRRTVDPRRDPVPGAAPGGVWRGRAHRAGGRRSGRVGGGRTCRFAGGGNAGGRPAGGGRLARGGHRRGADPGAPRRGQAPRLADGARRPALPVRDVARRPARATSRGPRRGMPRAWSRAPGCCCSPTGCGVASGGRGPSRSCSTASPP